MKRTSGFDDDEATATTTTSGLNRDNQKWLLQMHFLVYLYATRLYILYVNVQCHAKLITDCRLCNEECSSMLIRFVGNN